MAFPVSDTFKKVINESHTVNARVDICDPITDAVLYTLDTVTEGEVTEDRARTARRNGTFSAVDNRGLLTPKEATDLLAPYGNEFRPYEGVILPDGTTEWVPQGVIGIDKTNITDSGETFLIKCDGNDRSDRIARATFTDTLYVAAGTTVTAAATSILNTIGYAGPISFQVGDAVTLAQKTYNIGDNPWTALVELFTNAAAEVFFDDYGTLVSKTLPDWDSAPINWTVKEGVGGNLLSVARDMARSDTQPNWIVVTGESATNSTHIPFGQAFIDDPSSPMYIYGKYGRVTQHVQTNTITTDADAAAMAAHLLTQVSGLSEQVIANVLPNPAMRVDDVVSMARMQSRLDAVRVVIDQVSIPLVAVRGGQAISRRRSVTPGSVTTDSSGIVHAL